MSYKLLSLHILVLPFLRRKPIPHAQHGVAAEGQYSTPFICSPTLKLRFSKVSLASRLM